MGSPVCCLIGGGGFIGRHLVESLQQRGREVIVLDRQPPRPGFPDTEYIVGNYADEASFSRTLARVDEIIDLAYASQPKTSFENPLADLLDNVPSAVALFRRVHRSDRLKRILFVSSGGTVYGPTDRIPISENAPTRPISPYGITKLAIEKYAFMFHRVSGLPVIVVRPGNAYGPGQLPFTGQGFIATAIGFVLQGRPVPIFGTGSVRDYVYVTDLAAGIGAVLDRGQDGEVYNLGTGEGRSNLDVLDCMRPLAQAANLRVEASMLPGREFDVPANILDVAKVLQATGWQAIVPFQDGLASTWHAIAQSAAAGR
jgi:UDP-glucose 4-epimerase